MVKGWEENLLMKGMERSKCCPGLEPTVDILG
jgi:hypothetical protein